MTDPGPHDSTSPRLRTAEVLNRGAGETEEVDDAALARAGMLGQEWAQRQIWYRFAPMVYALLRRSLGPRRDIEDLLQTVFMRVFARLSALGNPAGLRSFIYSSGVRVVSEDLRRHRFRSRLRALLPVPRHDRRALYADFESRELLSRIQRVLDNMSIRVRAVFVLRRFDGLPLAEIATGLGLSLGTIERDLDKANRLILRAIRSDERLRAEFVTDASCGGVEHETR